MNWCYIFYMFYYKMIDFCEWGMIFVKFKMMYEMFGVVEMISELVDYLLMFLEFFVYGDFMDDSC